MGIDTGEAPLAALQLAAERHLRPLGFEPEDRPFSPHLTLGRFKTPAKRELEDIARPLLHERFGTVHVDELRLMRSELRAGGPEYSLLEAFPLG